MHTVATVRIRGASSLRIPNINETFVHQNLTTGPSKSRRI